MNVANGYGDISMADLVAVPETQLPPAPPKEQGQVALNGATALAETTSNDQASGSTRPQTPPPNQRVFAASNPPSRSSQESMIVATQNTTLPPTKALQRAENCGVPESPDPLLLQPVPSAASSAARSRSHSVEPPRSLFRSSPSSRGSARPRAKTPVPRDHSGENDTSGSDEIVALDPTPTRARAPRPPTVADDLSDDELTMNPIRNSTDRRQSPGKKVYPGKKKSTRTEKDSKIVTGQENDDRLAAVPQGSPSLKLSEGDSSRNDAQADRPSFVIDEPAGSPTPRRSSEWLAPSSSRSSPHRARGIATLAPVNGSAKVAASSHTLSQTISREDLGSPSSPLTSLPPTPAHLQPVKLASTSPPPSPASKTKRSRAHPPIPTVPREQYSEDEGATSSSTISNRSPRKKVKCRMPRASQVAVVSSSDEVEASPQASPRTSRGKVGRPSRTKSAPSGRRKSAGSDVPLEVLQFAAAANRNPRRKSAGAASETPKPTQDDDDFEADDADSGSDFEHAPKRSSPKEAPSPNKPGRPLKGGAAKAKKAPTGKSKGKGKAKGPSQSTLAADDEELTALVPVQTPSSSPTKQSGLSAPEAFGSQSLVTGRATRQTAEERKANWNMLYFPVGRPIWVHRRREGEGGFWWPGEIETSIFARPLSVKLYLDADETIKNFTDVHLKIEEPDSELLATFRNPSRLRFDQRIFRDLEDAPADGTPTDEAFATVLAHALERDAGADEAEDEDDLMPTPFGVSGSKAARATALEEAEASDDLEQLELEVQRKFSGDEADRLIEADAQEAEDANLDYPFLCLAMSRKTWWAARCTGYILGSPSKPASSNGNGKEAKRQAGKYVVEFTDGSTATIARKNLLTAKEKDFFTVKMGLTGLDISKQYIAKLKAFVTNDMVPIYQRVIDETLPMAQSRNDDFHAGGQKRERLATRSMFGELTDDIVEIFHNAISAWASGEGSDSGPPQGSARYAALTDSERVQYRTDVLLPIAIIENYVDDRRLFDEAEAALKQEGTAAPSDDEIKSRAYAMAEQDLDLRSVTKAVLAIRDSRDRVKAIAESRRVKRTR